MTAARTLGLAATTVATRRLWLPPVMGQKQDGKRSPARRTFAGQSLGGAPRTQHAQLAQHLLPMSQAAYQTRTTHTAGFKTIIPQASHCARQPIVRQPTWQDSNLARTSILQDNPETIHLALTQHLHLSNEVARAPHSHQKVSRPAPTQPGQQLLSAGGGLRRGAGKCGSSGGQVGGRVQCRGGTPQRMKSY